MFSTLPPDLSSSPVIASPVSPRFQSAHSVSTLIHDLQLSSSSRPTYTSSNPLSSSHPTYTSSNASQNPLYLSPSLPSIVTREYVMLPHVNASIEPFVGSARASLTTRDRVRQEKAAGGAGLAILAKCSAGPGSRAQTVGPPARQVHSECCHDRSEPPESTLGIRYVRYL